MTIWTALFAFLGAVIGGGLGAFATWRNLAQNRREEWGRRFTDCLQALTSDDLRRRRVGRALLVELLDSDLATDDDRRQADAVLSSAAVVSDRSGRDLRSVPGGELDDSRIVEDDETEHDRGRDGNLRTDEEGTQR